MKTIISVGTALILLSLSACKDSEVNLPPDVVSEFPLSVGSRWTYAVYASVSGRRDTVNVTIEQRIVAEPPKAVYLWQYQYLARTESLYVTRSRDTVRFSVSRDGSGQLVNIIFPLQVGRRWGTRYLDSTLVSARESVVVPGGSYAETFRIDQVSLLPNDLSRFQYWIEPNVGIVKIFRRVFITVDLGNNTKETWQLLWYSLAQ